MKTPMFSRPDRIVVAVVLALAMLVAASKTYTVVDAHQRAIDRAKRETQNAAGILAEHAARTFDAVSRALDAASDLRTDVETGTVAGAAAIYEALRSIHGSSPVIQAIGWSDAEGNRVASSIFRDPPPLNLAHQEQFRVQRDDPSVGLHISAPIKSLVDGAWIIPISRRVEDRNGRFAGIVNAVLRLDYFLDFYRAINLGPDTVIVMLGPNRTVLARQPMTAEWMGKRLPIDPPVAPGVASGSRPNSVELTSPIDGKERLVGVRAIPGFPQTVAASMSRDDALASFRDVLLSAAIEGLLTILALAAGGAIIAAVIRRRDAAAAELAETGALLQSVFAVTDQAIIVFDRDLRAVAWNDLCAEYFGPGLKLGRGAALRDMLADLAKSGEYGDGDIDAFITDRLANAKAGHPVRYERLRPNGTIVDVGWLPLPNGHLAIVHTDVTRVKQAEVALRDSEARVAQAHARLRDAVDSLADPFFLWDAEERLVLVNRAAVESAGDGFLVPGVRLEDAIAHHVRAGRFPAAIGREDDYIAERLAEMRRATGEPREVRRSDGVVMATWDRRTRDGGIVSLRVDITKIKQSETAIRESEAKVAQAYARLGDAIESLSDPFFLWDADERLILANSAAAAGSDPLTPGVRLEDVIRGRVMAGRFPNAIGREEEYIRERLEKIRRATGEPSEVRLADGRWLSVRDRRTREGGVVNLIVDITEAKKREAELSEARRAADAANRAKSDFLSRMSHELRTPLNAIIGFSQMLKLDQRNTLAPKQVGYCEDIENGGRHLLALVNDILDLARIETGNEQIRLERASVADALATLRAAAEALARGTTISLRIAAPAGIPDIRADDRRLHQALLNLVSNAIKYNRVGGSVSVSAEAISENRVRFTVADTGVGIAESRQAELFQPFHRLGQENSGIDGTGIGLSICKRLTEAMGGSVGFTSRVDIGSTFWVDLPVDVSLRAAAPGDRSVAAGAEPAALSHPFSLLYVEDNRANMRLVEHLISTLPHVALLTAATPQLGLDLARAHRPDVILLDLHLPGMNGYEMLAHLQAMPETKDIPVLALTAAAMPRDIERGLAAGFTRYLTKPIDIREFLTAIGECIPLSIDEDEEMEEEEARQAAG